MNIKTELEAMQGLLKMDPTSPGLKGESFFDINVFRLSLIDLRLKELLKQIGEENE